MVFACINEFIDVGTNRFQCYYLYREMLENVLNILIHIHTIDTYTQHGLQFCQWYSILLLVCTQHLCVTMSGALWNIPWCRRVIPPSPHTPHTEENNETMLKVGQSVSCAQSGAPGKSNKLRLIYASQNYISPSFLTTCITSPLLSAKYFLICKGYSRTAIQKATVASVTSYIGLTRYKKSIFSGFESR